MACSRRLEMEEGGRRSEGRKVSAFPPKQPFSAKKCPFKFSTVHREISELLSIFKFFD